MGNIELKIDGEVIVLTSSQTAQLKRAVVKETSTPAPRSCSCFMLSCKTKGVKSAFPFVLSTNNPLPEGARPSSTCSSTYKGRDFNQTELKTLITELRAYAKKIWPSFK